MATGLARNLGVLIKGATLYVYVNIQFQHFYFLFYAIERYSKSTLINKAVIYLLMKNYFKLMSANWIEYRRIIVITYIYK